MNWTQQYQGGDCLLRVSAPGDWFVPWDGQEESCPIVPKPWEAQAKKCGLPAVVVLDQQGLPRTEKLPATPEAMVELVGRVAK